MTLDVVDAAQHPQLERLHRHVLSTALRLLGDEVGVDGEDVLDAGGVLTVRAVTTVSGWQTHAGERHDVSLDARAPGGSVQRRPDDGGRGIARRCVVIPGDEDAHPPRLRYHSRSGAILAEITATHPHGKPPYKTWMCLICGYIYNEESGSDEGLPACAGSDIPPTGPVPEWAAQGRFRNDRDLTASRP